MKCFSVCYNKQRRLHGAHRIEKNIIEFKKMYFMDHKLGNFAVAAGKNNNTHIEKVAGVPSVRQSTHVTMFQTNVFSSFLIKCHNKAEPQNSDTSRRPG